MYKFWYTHIHKCLSAYVYTYDKYMRGCTDVCARKYSYIYIGTWQRREPYECVGPPGQRMDALALRHCITKTGCWSCNSTVFRTFNSESRQSLQSGGFDHRSQHICIARCYPSATTNSWESCSTCSGEGKNGKQFWLLLCLMLPCLKDRIQERAKNTEQYLEEARQDFWEMHM